MGQTYTVQVLSDKEFDNLPYKGISDSLGIADKEKGLAFVRNTGVKEWNLEILSHEIDHLVSKHTTHTDEYGIAHKKGGVMKSIVPILLGAIAAPFTGGSSLIPMLLGAASSVGMNQYAQSQHPEQLGEPGNIGSMLLQGVTGAASGLGGAGVSGAVAGGIKGGTAAAPGFLSKAGGILEGVGKGALSGAGEFAPTTPSSGIVTGTNSLANTFNASQAGSPLLGSPVTLGGVTSNITGGAAGLTAAPLAAGVGAGLGSLLGSSVSGANKIGSSIAPTTPATVSPISTPNTIGSLTSALEKTQMPSALSPAAINTPSITTPVSAFPAVTEAVNPVTSTGLLGNLGKKAGEFLTNPANILGAGSLLASTAVKQPEFQMPASVEEIRSKLLSSQGGLTDIGKQAQLELGTILKSTPQELYPPENDAYYQAALRRTRDSYATAKKNLDAQYNLAGVYGSGEHLAAQAKLQEQLTNTESDLYAQTEARNFELARTAKYQAIQDSLGVDKNVMDDLVGLTGLDVNLAAQIYGAQVADVKAIRDALGTTGIELIKGKMASGQTQQTI